MCSQIDIQIGGLFLIEKCKFDFIPGWGVQLIFFSRVGLYKGQSHKDFGIGEKYLICVGFAYSWRRLKSL